MDDGPLVTNTDTDLLDWAEKNPEKTLNTILAWWAMCGPGCREEMFNFRGCIQEAYQESQ